VSHRLEPNGPVWCLLVRAGCEGCMMWKRGGDPSGWCLNWNSVRQLHGAWRRRLCGCVMVQPAVRGGYGYGFWLTWTTMWCDIQVRMHVDFILVILIVGNAVLLKFVSLPTAVFLAVNAVSHPDSYVGYLVWQPVLVYDIRDSCMVATSLRFFAWCMYRPT